MTERGKGILANWESSGDEVRQAMDHAIADALRAHRKAGNPVVFWDRENDRIVTVPPEEIVVPDEHAKAMGPAGTGDEIQVKVDFSAPLSSGFSQQSDKN